MHLAIEVVCQPPVVVQPTQIRAAHVADLQLLVARGPARVRQSLELALPVRLDLLRLPQLEMLGDGDVDGADGAERLDLLQRNGDSSAEVRDLAQQGVGLADLVGGLLEAALRLVDLAVALVDILCHVAGVVELEGPAPPLVRVGALVLCLERLAVHARARPDVLLGVGEEVVRARAGEVGAADLGIRDGELRLAGGARAVHELFAHELLYASVSVLLFRRGGARWDCEASYRAAFSVPPPWFEMVVEW